MGLRCCPSLRQAVGQGTRTDNRGGLRASLQFVGPGEIEDAHRHVASAFRFVLEGTGAHTTVAGEKFYLAPGDVVLTPNMAWHEHGNETNGPMIMFDALDIPLVNHFGASCYLPAIFGCDPGSSTTAI